MWKIATALGAGLCVLALGASGCGGGGSGTVAPVTGEVTVTGEVVCLVCFTQNPENIGADHDRGFACAQACVKWEGNPAGLVTADGTLYQLAGELVANNNERIAAHVAHRVTVAGEAYEEAGMLMLSASDLTMAE